MENWCQQDRSGQGMNERGAILPKGNDNNARPHTERWLRTRSQPERDRAVIFPAHRCALMNGVLRVGRWSHMWKSEPDTLCA